jgi:2,4-dichlorophenol 6-monooxygenase
LGDALNLQHWHFNALGVEIGQFYTSSAIKADGAKKPEPTQDPELYYEPTTVPGGRLPHAWLLRDGKQVSTHDITGKGRFVLLTGVADAAWRKAAMQLAEETGLPLAVETIGIGQKNADVFYQWDALSDISQDGAILVRPDAHIAWRARTAVTNHYEALKSAFEHVLSRSEKVPFKTRYASFYS